MTGLKNWIRRFRAPFNLKISVRDVESLIDTYIDNWVFRERTAKQLEDALAATAAIEALQSLRETLVGSRNKLPQWVPGYEYITKHQAADVKTVETKVGAPHIEFYGIQPGSLEALRQPTERGKLPKKRAPRGNRRRRRS